MNIWNDKIENKFCKMWKKLLKSAPLKNIYDWENKECKVALLCKVDKWEPSEVQWQRITPFENCPTYLILEVRALNLEILFNSYTNVQERTCARALRARKCLDTQTSLQLRQTKAHGQTAMHHSLRLTAITMATDIDLYPMFLHIFLGGLLRDKDVLKRRAEICAWCLWNEKGFCPHF